MESKYFTIYCDSKEFVVKAKKFNYLNGIYFFYSDDESTKVIAQFPISRSVIFIKDK